MSTRPDIRAKREKVYHGRKTEIEAMHAKARDLEQQAASIAHTIASMDCERISMMIEAAMLRKAARG